MFTGCNYVTENKNNDCIAILDSGGGGINQIAMCRAHHHIWWVENKKNSLTSIVFYERLHNPKQENKNDQGMSNTRISDSEQNSNEIVNKKWIEIIPYTLI